MCWTDATKKNPTQGTAVSRQVYIPLIQLKRTSTNASQIAASSADTQEQRERRIHYACHLSKLPLPHPSCEQI